MEVSLAGRIVLYVLLGLYAVGLIGLWFWQFQVFRGKAMKNPDGSSDDWHDEPMVYGLALADMVFSIPVGLIGIIFILVGYPLGHYIMGMVAFWFVWINLATTATSLRFNKPRTNLVAWVLAYPALVMLGLAYLGWIGVHYETFFGSMI